MRTIILLNPFHFDGNVFNTYRWRFWLRFDKRRADPCVIRVKRCVCDRTGRSSFKETFFKWSIFSINLSINSLQSRFSSGSQLSLFEEYPFQWIKNSRLLLRRMCTSTIRSTYLWLTYTILITVQWNRKAFFFRLNLLRSLHFHPNRNHSQVVRQFSADAVLARSLSSFAFYLPFWLPYRHPDAKHENGSFYFSVIHWICFNHHHNYLFIILCQQSRAWDTVRFFPTVITWIVALPTNQKVFVVVFEFMIENGFNLPMKWIPDRKKSDLIRSDVKYTEIKRREQQTSMHV